VIPRTLSASSLQVAEACLARWGAEYYHRASQPGGSAANVGTSVHGALEMFVKACHLGPDAERVTPTLKFILDLYKMSYMQTFNTADIDTEAFADGYEMTKKWYERTSFEGFEVLSAEVKSTFPIKSSAGEIPFNYIWDRCDQLDEKTFRVVDYKTIRLPVTSKGLREKIQPRCYGLAAQIQFPEAERIWVEYDLLRHDRVGTVFTREDNIATWQFLKRSAERLIAADEKNLPETLNPDCRYCVRKHNCLTLKKNVLAGGVFSIDPMDAVDRRAELKYAMDAMKMMADDLDRIILQYAENEELLEWETATTKVNIGARATRGVDAERASKILGPELMARYGKLNIGDVDRLLKGGELAENQKKALKSLIVRTVGEAGVKVSPVSPLDED
jgi:RecB family exonuclease